MINKLVQNIKKTNAPIVVGLDPMLNYIPEHVQKKAFAEFGETLEGAAEAIWQFNKEIVDKTYDLIPAVKPQIAMYEQFGIPGLVAFKKTVDYCKEKGLVVIGDIKRGDIGSTSAAYAVGHVGRVQVGSKTYVPFDEDYCPTFEDCTNGNAQHIFGVRIIKDKDGFRKLQMYTDDYPYEKMSAPRSGWFNPTMYGTFDEGELLTYLKELDDKNNE